MILCTVGEVLDPPTVPIYADFMLENWYTLKVGIVRVNHWTSNLLCELRLVIIFVLEYEWKSAV